MPTFWERQTRRAGNALSNTVIDPLRSAGRGLVGGAQDAWDFVSGASATDKALNQQMQGIDQAKGAIQDAYNQGQGFLSPYMQGAGQNFSDFSGMVRSGAFNPQFQAYQGPMQSAGQFDPQYRAYQGPMSSAGRFDPTFQAYQGPMSSGNQLPQFQQFQGASQFEAQARPERMAGTAANVNMYQDPGYQFRLNEGLNAVQNRLAGRGLIGSGAELKGLNDYAQGMASQEFGNAYGRFMQDQANRQGDFERDRGFGMQNFNQNFQNAYGMNRDLNAWNAQNADRGQSWFEGDRAAGLQQNQFQNQFGLNRAGFQQGAFEGDRAAGMADAQNLNNYLMNRANFQQGAFEGDRAAGLGYNQFQNTWNMNNTQNNLGAWQGLVGMGYNAAGQGADMATNFGSSLAGLYGDAANARANATMTQSNQRRGLFGDLFDAGTKVFGMVKGG